jgi:hypothetical protein
MSKLYRGPAIDASYQGLNNSSPLKPFCQMNRNLVGNILGRSSIKIAQGASIDASYQVSVHLAKRFQRRRILKISQSETRIACGGHVY